MKKILIAPSNTDLNRGDQALIWESVNLCKNLYPDAEYYLYKSGLTAEERELQSQQTKNFKYTFFERILAHPGRGASNKNVKLTKLTYIKWGGVAIYDILVTLLLISKFSLFNSLGYYLLSDSRKKTLSFIRDEMDILVLKGGGFLHSYGSFADAYIMYFQLYDVFLANRYKKKIIVFPNSVGPLKNKLAKIIVSKALSCCYLVTARESTSYDLLNKLDLKTKIVKSPDLGFYLLPSNVDFKKYFEDLGISFTKKLVAITMRPYRFENISDSYNKYQQYIESFCDIVNELVNKDIQVCLVAHTLGPSKHEDDRVAISDLMKKLKVDRNVFVINETKWNCQDIEKFYSYFDLIIGTRFHSVIFSLNVYVPAIAISYGGNKAKGIMNDLDLSRFVVNIEDVDSNYVLSLVDFIFDNREYYIEKIKKYKEKLYLERSILIDLLKDL